MFFVCWLSEVPSLLRPRHPKPMPVHNVLIASDLPEDCTQEMLVKVLSTWVARFGALSSTRNTCNPIHAPPLGASTHALRNCVDWWVVVLNQPIKHWQFPWVSRNPSSGSQTGCIYRIRTWWGEWVLVMSPPWLRVNACGGWQPFLTCARMFTNGLRNLAQSLSTSYNSKTT